MKFSLLKLSPNSIANLMPNCCIFECNKIWSRPNMTANSLTQRNIHRCKQFWRRPTIIAVFFVILIADVALSFGSYHHDNFPSITLAMITCHRNNVRPTLFFIPNDLKWPQIFWKDLVFEKLRKIRQYFDNIHFSFGRKINYFHATFI